MERNQSFENSLRCLQHPISLLSIALLLLNDHVFKVISPSWLTGKSSDFAGLFFFPFIVAAGLSLLLAKSNFEARDTGKLAFGFVAIWFVLLKTFPVVNSITSQLSSFVVGFPTQFILDWTDIVGLTAMIPAWKLWNQSQQRRQNSFAYVALSIGALAAIATSPAEPTVEAVTHLLVKNETVVAFDKIRGAIAVSEDGGRTWAQSHEHDDTFPNEYVSLPIVVCVPDNQNECYRINGEKNVEISKDGGKSWDISWELPADRVKYLNQANPNLDLGPYDLIMIQRQNRNYVLVAAGEDGILRKELPYGDWERIAVENAKPISYKATSLPNAISVTWREILFWFILSIFAFHASCWLVWSANSKNSPELLSKAQWIFSPALSPLLGIFLTVFITIIVGFVSLTVAQLSLLDNNIMNALFIVSILCVVAALAFIPGTIYFRLNAWRLLLIKNHYTPQTALKLVWLAYLTHICVFLTGCVFWIAWAMDVISRYDIILISVLASTTLVALIFFRKIENLSKQYNVVSNSK